MRRNGPTDLGLLADYHRLQNVGVAEAKRSGDGAVSPSEGGGCERWGAGVQSVTNFINCFGLGFDEGSGGIKGVYFISLRYE